MRQYGPCLPIMKRHTHARGQRYCIFKVQPKLYLVVDRLRSRFAYSTSEAKARVMAEASEVFEAQYINPLLPSQGPPQKMKKDH